MRLGCESIGVLRYSRTLALTMRQLLIDGHNLIGQMPGLSLADFDDEEKLVAFLRKHAARKRARIVVVFDSGQPGGRSRHLSGGGVESVFAGSHTNADRILIERIRALKQPQTWTLVSSDRAIQREAEARRMPVKSSAEFAAELAPPASASSPPRIDEKPSHEDDIDAWIDAFRRRHGPGD